MAEGRWRAVSRRDLDRSGSAVHGVSGLGTGCLRCCDGALTALVLATYLGQSVTLLGALGAAGSRGQRKPYCLRSLVMLARLAAATPSFASGLPGLRITALVLCGVAAVRLLFPIPAREAVKSTYSGLPLSARVPSTLRRTRCSRPGSPPVP